MKALIDAIRTTPGCVVMPASGLPDVGHYTLPEDLIAFYTECGGIQLFSERAYGMTLVSPMNFVKANPVIAGVEGTNDRSADWFIAAKSGEQYVTIDLNPQRLGRCYDSFWDRHAVAGSCAVIANSYAELVNKLVAAGGKNWFWLLPVFVGYGDAYD